MNNDDIKLDGCFVLVLIIAMFLSFGQALRNVYARIGQLEQQVQRLEQR